MSTADQPGRFPAEQTAFRGPFQASTRLPEGDWHVLANGRIYTLTISDVSGGNVTAKFTSGGIEDATWDAGDRRLSFVRVLPNLRQRFTGFLMHFDDEDPKWRMAGEFHHLPEEGTGAEIRHQSGWYATRPRS